MFAFVLDGLRIAVYDTRLQRNVAELVGHTDKITALSWDHRSERLASASFDKAINIWDVGKGECLQILRGHLGPVLAVDWEKREGAYIATGGADNNLFIWYVEKGSILSKLSGHLGAVKLVHWNPATNLLASACEGRVIRIWSYPDWKPVKAFRCPAGIMTMKWSPNGLYIAAGCDDGVIRVWDVEGKLVRELHGHTGKVVSVDWSPDLKMVSGGEDRTIRVWDPGLEK